MTSPDNISAVFREYRGPLTNYAASIIHHREDAKDMVSDAFIRATRQFNDRDHLINKLFVTVRNLCINYLNYHKRPLPLESAPELSEDAVIRIMVLTEHMLAVRAAIEKLPPKRKQVLELIRDGYSHEEIGQITGMSPELIRNTKCQAIAQVRAMIKTSIK